MKIHAMRCAAIFVLFSCALVATWMNTSVDAADAKNQAMRKEAERAFKTQSYTQAITKAEAYLKTSPVEAEANAMLRLIGLSRIRLGQHADGEKVLVDLMTRDRRIGSDPEVADALASAALATGRNEPAEVMRRIDRAVTLFGESRYSEKQISLLFSLAQYLESHFYTIRLENAEPQNPLQRVRTVAEILRVYDRILALPAPIQAQLRARNGQTDTLLRHGHELRPVPRDQWPAFMPGDYDLSRPFEQAIAFQQQIIRQFSEHASASAAAFRIGEIHEQHRSDFVSAVSAFREVGKSYPRSPEAQSAQQRIANIQAPQLSVRIEGVALPGTRPKLHWNTRNIKTIRLAAYPVELMHLVRTLESLYEVHRYPLGAAKPVAQWTIETGEKGNHQFVSSGSSPSEAPLADSNAYLVVAEGSSTSGTTVRAHILMLVSRLGLMVKTGQAKAGVFAMDAVTGEPKADTKLLIQRFVRQVRIPLLNITRDEFTYEDVAVPDSGLANLDLPRQTGDSWHRRMLVIAKQGNDYAISDGGYSWYWWTFRDGYRVYSFTDRPVYRPDQTVYFKHVVRRYDNGSYQVVANRKARVRILDARNNTVYDREQVTNEAGSTDGSVALGESPALGMYRIELQFNDGVPIDLGPGVSFRVEEYKKPEFQVTIVPNKATFRIGEQLSVRVHGEYYFGGPVAHSEVRYTIHRQSSYVQPMRPMPFDWYYGDFAAPAAPLSLHRRTVHWGDHAGVGPMTSDLVASGSSRTDAEGNVTLSARTEAYAHAPQADLEYRFDVAMVDPSRREIRASSAVKVTHHALYISVSPQRHLYQPGDRVRLTIRGSNANGGPVAFKGRSVVSLVRRREVRDTAGMLKQQEQLEPIVRREVAMNADGESELEFVADRQGYYRIDVSAQDDYGGDATGSAHVWVAKGAGEFAHYAHSDLEMVLDNDTKMVGESLGVLLNSKHKDAYVWITAEADELYHSRIVAIAGTQTTIEIPITRQFQPNVTIRASLFRDNRMHQDERQLKVPPTDQFLNVAIRASKTEFRPRETTEVEVSISDHTGNPVATELSLGCVDASVFYIQDETRGDIRKFFHGRQRPLLVNTTSSYAFQFWAHGHHYRDGALLGRSGQSRFDAVGASMSADSAPAAAMRPLHASPESAVAEMKSAKAEPQIRSEFPDTVLWLANLTTGSDGKAKATVRFPDSLTTWRLTALAATNASQVGEVRHEVRTRKNIIVRLAGPRFYVERDAVVLSAIVHNFLAQAKRVQVSLDVSKELEIESPSHARREIEIAPGSERRIDFPVKVRRAGKVTIVAKAVADVESDGVQMEFPVLEFGAHKLLAESGILFGDAQSQSGASARLLIPDAIRPGSQRLSIEASPTVAGVLLAALPYLLEYPYGCTEQTMSRFVPAVLTAHTLRQLGVNLSALHALAEKDPLATKRFQQFRASPVYDSREMDRMVNAGVSRLADFQRPDGGWGWWKNDQSNPYMTAYVVSGLSLAAEANVQLPKGMLERGGQYLAAGVVQTRPITRYSWQREEDSSVRVYMLYALGQADRSRLRLPDVLGKLRESYRDRDGLNDYSRALLALALHAAGMHEEASIVIDNLSDRAHVDDATHSASWGDFSGYYYWYQSGTEATCYSLKALLTVEPTSPLIPKAVNWLVRHRSGTRWFNTKDTATACYALADYMRRTSELDPDLEISIDVDGRTSKTVRITRANLFTADAQLELTGERVGVGEKVVTIRRRGRGNVYWAAYASFFSKEHEIAEAGNEIFIRRQYFRLTPRAVKVPQNAPRPVEQGNVDDTRRVIDYERRLLATGEGLSSGDLIAVELEIDARNNFEYLVFEDPKPAGCEPIELRSGYAWGGGLGAHMELRDEKVAFFATYLNQGKHKIEYRLRAETPGTFHALPSRAECMYTPRVAGNAHSRVIRVAER